MRSAFVISTKKKPDLSHGIYESGNEIVFTPRNDLVAFAP